MYHFRAVWFWWIQGHQWCKYLYLFLLICIVILSHVPTSKIPSASETRGLRNGIHDDTKKIKNKKKQNSITYKIFIFHCSLRIFFFVKTNPFRWYIICTYIQCRYVIHVSSVITVLWKNEKFTRTQIFFHQINL